MMNRPENVLYNYCQNTPTAATTSTENPERHFAEVSEKLPVAIANPMQMVSNRAKNDIPATNQIEPPMPKRNLSSYNLFFQLERENIIKGEEGMNYTHENIAGVALRHYQQGKTEQPRRKHRKTHGKISFAELARTVAKRWKQIDPITKEMFVRRTNIEKARYQAEIAEWADKKLRAMPSSPKWETQPDPYTVADVLRPDMLSANAGTGVVNEHSRAARQSDIMQQVDSIMPHRVFPPDTTSYDIQYQTTANRAGGNGNTVFPFNNATYADMYSQIPSGMGWVDRNSLYELTQQQQFMADTMYRPTAAAYAGDEFTILQAQQYQQQMSFQPFQTTDIMALQHQLGMMVDRQGFDTQGQSSSQGFPPSLSMRSQPTVLEPVTQRGDGFVSVPNEMYASNEPLQHNIQHQPALVAIPSQGEMYTTRQGPMRYDAQSDDNEHQDLQSLFNRFDAN